MKAAARYRVHDLDHPENWRSEPHVDEDIFRTMLQDSGVAVHFHERLREQRGVKLHGRHLVSIMTADGKHWPAKVFADCSYEGDLMAQAKVSYTWGREASAEYGEDLEVNRWGLPKDEFADTDHWPNQLYIREGRRLVGEYVMRQADLQTERTKPDSIGMGSYNSDSHNIQRVAMPDGTVQNEGDVQVSVEPYEIAYRSILRK